MNYLNQNEMLTISKGKNQRAKINKTFSSWTELVQGVQQSSVIGPLIYKNYIIVFFYKLTHELICNFTDDTTPYAYNESLEKLSVSMSDKFGIIIRNYLKSYIENFFKFECSIENDRNIGKLLLIKILNYLTIPY